MKIVCEGIDLSDATLKVVKACSSKTTVPVLECPYAWYLSVNTWGDENGRFVYREGEEVRIDSEFIMHPRSVAVFTGREQP